MIIYVILIFFFLLIFLCALLRLNASVLYVQSLFWFFGFVGLLSVLYLEAFDVYIVEQFRVSHVNGAALMLCGFIFMHLLGVFLGVFLYGKKISVIGEERSREYNKNSGLLGFLILCVSLFILLVLYINLMISAMPPLLQDGYIDRFEYIQSTELWWLIKPMGVVAVPLPIMLGWLWLVLERSKFIVLVLVVFYIFYLALIGQKFGGFVLSFFLFFLPIISDRSIAIPVSAFISRIFLPVAGLFCLALLMVYYHYSQYSLADKFGGPLGLLIYRVLGLQGHAFWGAFDFFISDPWSYFNPGGFVDGMENVMRLISPEIADGMIERGVRFTFGYFASLLVHLGFFSFPAALFFGFLHSLLAVNVVAFVVRRNFFRYFIIANVLVIYNGFISMGSLSYLLDFKLLFLLLSLFLLAFVKRGTVVR